MKYCPQCREALETRTINEQPRRACAHCGFIYWNNPLPVVGAVVIDELGDILLARRAVDPEKGKWNLPAGFMEWGESAEQATCREVWEETGMEIEITGYLTSVGSLWPRERSPWYSNTFVFFYGRPVGGVLQGGDDADEAMFFSPDALPEDFAFQSHKKALRHWQLGRANGVAQALGK